MAWRPWVSCKWQFLVVLLSCWTYACVPTSTACMWISTQAKSFARSQKARGFEGNCLAFCCGTNSWPRLSNNGIPRGGIGRLISAHRSARKVTLHAANRTQQRPQSRATKATKESCPADITHAGHGLWDNFRCPIAAEADRFVLFGDLHMSEATVNTCLDALSLVQQTCKRQCTSLGTVHQKGFRPVAVESGERNPKPRDAPTVAVFLGDFWHSRVEKHLHWGLLRPLLEFWEQWDIPVRSRARGTPANMQFSRHRH